VRILLLGKNGQLGWELRRTLAPLGSIAAVDYEDVDLADSERLRLKVRELRPEVIVNAAAYTAVDKAESEPAKAYAINANAPGILAEEARHLDAVLIHYSTDYVFDGTKGQPYSEADAANPLNVYGASKLAGERSVQALGAAFIILRTAWVYSSRSSSFVTKVLDWARKNESLRIVDDQVSNPTWARALAESTAHVVGKGKGYLTERTGLYHLAGAGYASRYAWAQEILKFDSRPEQQTAKGVLRAATSDIPTPARRPLFSALDCSRFGAAFDGIALPSWQDALMLAME
jgi:dTDP-4-dehydrorhamnose reductase